MSVCGVRQREGDVRVGLVLHTACTAHAAYHVRSELSWNSVSTGAKTGDYNEAVGMSKLMVPQQAQFIKKD